MAIKQQPDNSSLWHDLGVAYWRHLVAGCGDKGERRMVAGKAVQALQKAVTIAPTNHSHWTALGVLAASGGMSLLRCLLK